MKDYRLEENREEAFVKWMTWSVVYNDCDSALYMTNYLFDRFEHNIEQKLWMAWIYGTTYHLPTAWVIWNEFPDFELVDQERLEKWNGENYKRLRYQTDTKYNKGHLPTQFASYRKWVHSTASTQRAKMRQFVSEHGSATKNFNALYDEVSTNLHKFGRYTGWFYLQTLKQCVGLNIDAPDLKLRDSGSKSHRNGLLFALGLEKYTEYLLTKEFVADLEVKAATLLEKVKEALPEELRYKADFFAMETCLCSFKKLFRKSRGRYLGYYLDRQAEEISQVEHDGWDGICWRPFWEARKETIRPDLLDDIIDKKKMENFLDFGSLNRLEYLYIEDKSTKTMDVRDFLC